MKDGLCPKCGAQTVYRRKFIWPGYGISSIQVKEEMSQTLPLDNYICTSCGYVELYLEDASAMIYITDHWDGVESAESDRDTRRLPPLPPL